MKNKSKSISVIFAVILMLSILIGIVPMTVFAEEETCAHTNAVFYDFEGVAPSCFEPGIGGYWFCEECSQYLDESKENGYWEELLASKIPATGHAFNADTGSCDNCGLANPVYTKVTSLDDINEEDMYIIVAEVETQASGEGSGGVVEVVNGPVEVGGSSGGTKYFVLGGLYTNEPMEDGTIWCGADIGNAISVTPNEDGTISLLNQNTIIGIGPSEFMLDVNPDQWNFTENGLTTVMPLLPNYCVYSFQSSSFENTGYMGVPRYGNGEYGMWDSSAWVIDFYTTEVTEDTYRYEDEFGSKTHAEQVADGNIGENISEGDLLLYKASFYAVGGAMFTLRFREYPNPETGTTEYYFICGEDWALEGSPGWDYVTDTTPTNDTQYAISLYRYDVPSAPAHTCDFGDWVADEGSETHTRTCKDATCGKTETLPHNWDAGVQSGTANCLTGVTTTYTCTDNCGATKSETAEGLGHDWNAWTDDGENAPYDTHSHTCNRGCGVAAETESHTWSSWVKEDATNHKKTCSGCNGTRIAAHTFGEWTPVGDGTTERRDCTEASCDAYETRTPHVCTFGSWYETEDGMKHRRDCTATDCGEYEEGDHSFGDFAKIDEHFHGRTCSVCNAEKKTEHSFYDWIAKDNNDHVHECMECDYESVLPHDYVSAVTKEPTVTEAGEVTYTCTLCSHSYTEELPRCIVEVSGEVVGTVLNVPTGSNAYIPEGTVFDVVEQPATEIPEQVLGEIAVTAEGAAKPLGMFDLSLLLDDATVQPNGTVVVTLPAPDLAAEYDQIIVVYIAPDGSYEECKTTVNEDGTISFETDHFSKYAVIGIEKAQEEKDHSKCLEEASGWKRFWNSIGNFFRRLFSDFVKCVCGDKVNEDDYTRFKDIFKQNRK